MRMLSLIDKSSTNSSDNDRTNQSLTFFLDKHLEGTLSYAWESPHRPSSSIIDQGFWPNALPSLLLRLKINQRHSFVHSLKSLYVFQEFQSAQKALVYNLVHSKYLHLLYFPLTLLLFRYYLEFTLDLSARYLRIIITIIFLLLVIYSPNLIVIQKQILLLFVHLLRWNSLLNWMHQYRSPQNFIDRLLQFI